MEVHHPVKLNDIIAERPKKTKDLNGYRSAIRRKSHCAAELEAVNSAIC